MIQAQIVAGKIKLLSLSMLFRSGFQMHPHSNHLSQPSYHGEGPAYAWKKIGTIAGARTTLIESDYWSVDEWKEFKNLSIATFPKQLQIFQSPPSYLSKKTNIHKQTWLIRQTKTLHSNGWVSLLQHQHPIQISWVQLYLTATKSYKESFEGLRELIEALYKYRLSDTVYFITTEDLHQHTTLQNQFGDLRIESKKIWSPYSPELKGEEKRTGEWVYKIEITK